MSVTLRCNKKGLSKELRSLMETVDSHSNVIVSMPAAAALALVTDDTTQYVNYERLVGSGARSPSSFANDAQRAVVAGALFASFGEDIVYGALSLSDRGLATYGDIYCRLKRVTIERRTSFLETNSYHFVKNYGDSNHPQGHKSDWANRGKLVAIKLAESNGINKGDGPPQWEERVLISDGMHREYDAFIEAHIFGPFTLFSIEKIVPAQPLAREVRTIVRAIIEAFESRNASQ